MMARGNPPELALPALVLDHAARYPEETALLQKCGARWVALSWADYARRVRHVAAGLFRLGLMPPCHIGIFAENSTDWVVSQMATGLIGGCAFGLYPTSSPQDVRHALGLAEAQLVFCENAQKLAKLDAIRDELPGLRWIVMFDGAGVDLTRKDILTLADVEQAGAAALDAAPGLLDGAIAGLTLDQPGLIVFTSGSTGPPKAAMLSFRNMRTAALGFGDRLGFAPGAVVLSYLPLCHIAEQAMTNFAPLHSRTAVAFGGGLGSLVEDLRHVRPTYFSGVPRVWLRLQAQMEQAGTGLDYVGLDRTRVATSGAASLPVAVLDYFRGQGLALLELYGMTENCSIMTLHHPDRVVPGTVGEPIATVELQLADDGEILVRGEAVFLGYYKDPAATAQTVVDGWLHTGDIGRMEQGQLRIIDRKKDIMITDGGKNISPAEIEGLMRTSPLIAECVLVAEGRKYVAALIQIDPAGFGGADYAALVAAPATQAALLAEIARLNVALPRVAQIKRACILPQPLQAEAGELTPTLKLRRFMVHKRYAKDIEGIYAGLTGFDIPPSRA